MNNATYSFPNIFFIDNILKYIYEAENMSKLGIPLFALGLAVLVSLSWWQISRYQAAQQSQYASKSETPTIQVIRGEFLHTPSHWLLDNITQQHNPGYYLLSLFESDDGNHWLVARNWIATRGDRIKDVEELSLPSFPSTQIEVQPWLTSRIKSASYPWKYRSIVSNDEVSAAIIQTIDIDRIKSDTGIVSNIQVASLVSTGNPVVQLEQEWLIPERHLGYAMTWGLLALFWCIVWVSRLKKLSKN